MSARRCIQCSGNHCCNSWCKEESVLLQLYVLLSVSQAPTFIPTLNNLCQKLSMDVDLSDLLRALIPMYDTYARPEVYR